MLAGPPARAGFVLLRKLIYDRRAVTAVEYGILCALMLSAIIVAVFGYSTSLGSVMSNTFATLANHV